MTPTERKRVTALSTEEKLEQLSKFVNVVGEYSKMSAARVTLSDSSGAARAARRFRNTQPCEEGSA